MSSRIIATPSYTKEILDEFDLRAKKNYGQNFLVEPGIVEKIAISASNDCKNIVEIGPGIGALTQMLAEHAEKVTSYEIDTRLLPVLSKTLAEYENVEIINQDFLTADIKAKFGEEEIAVAANLPYYITTPILFKLFESDANIKTITVMMQKEVADRFNATVNTKDYNALTVIVNYLCSVSLVVKVPKNVFNPKPNVDSAVLKFTLLKNRQLEKKLEQEFFDLVKACFKQRRKTIYNNLRDYLKDQELANKILINSNVDLSRRAESLTLDEFLNLYKEYKLCK